MEKPRILFVDDEKLAHDTTKIVLENVYGNELAFAPEYHLHPQTALNSVRKNPFNVCAVFLDEQIRDGSGEKISGCEFIPDIKDANSYIKVIMLSGDMSGGALAQWVKARADNYLYKDGGSESEKLTIFINDAVGQFNAKFGELLGSRHANRFKVKDSVREVGIISTSPKLEAVAEVVAKVSQSVLEPAVMLIGESGTGKELIAHAIHNLSQRRKAPLRVIDCTHFKDSDIIASELFGSEKGAFTGAETRPGLFELADGGTAFIDEIHQLGPTAQGMLLRFLQDKILRRVGGKTERKVNVRLVFAGKPIFEEMVQRGEFLADLAYRMRQVVITLPPLRERDNDIEVLAYHFLEEVNQKTKLNQKFHPDTIELIKRHSWPGNVRELKSAIESVCTLVQDLVILPEHFIKSANFQPDEAHVFIPGQMTIPKLREQFENQMINLILRTYQHCNCNCTETAKLLSIPRTSLLQLCQSLGIREALEIKKDKSQVKETLDRYMRLVFAARAH